MSNLQPSAIQIYIFLLYWRNSSQCMSASKLPIKIIDNGIVILPTLSNVSKSGTGQLNGRNNISSPIKVDRIPGLKNNAFQFTLRSLLVKRYIPYVQIKIK